MGVSDQTKAALDKALADHVADAGDGAILTDWALGYTCELCGDHLNSYRAMMECETRCEQEQRDARRPARHVTRPARYWDDE